MTNDAYDNAQADRAILERLTTPGPLDLEAIERRLERAALCVLPSSIDVVARDGKVLLAEVRRLRLAVQNCFEEGMIFGWEAADGGSDKLIHRLEGELAALRPIVEDVATAHVAGVPACEGRQTKVFMQSTLVLAARAWRDQRERGHTCVPSCSGPLACLCSCHGHHE